MGEIPITMEQRFIHTAVEGSGLNPRLHHMAVATRLVGPVDPGRLAQAATQLSATYPILRTTFATSGDHVVQQPQEPLTKVEVIDGAEETDAELNRMLSKKAEQPFDLMMEHPFRVTVVRRAENEAFLLLTGHHMVVDAIGINIVLERYLRIYANLVTGNPASTDRGPEPDYFAFARSQPEELASSATARKVEYWRTEVTRARSVLEFPERGTDPKVQSLGALGFNLDAKEAVAINEYAKYSRVTSFTLVTAAILAALSEVSANDEILLSVVSDNRGHKYRHCIGQFADTFLLRSPLSPEVNPQQLRSITNSLSNSVLNRLPSEYLKANIECLRQRSISYGMSEVVVDYLTERTGSLRIPQVPDHEISRFPLTRRRVAKDLPYHGMVLAFHIFHSADGLSGHVLYEQGVMKRGTADTIWAALMDRLKRLAACSVG